MQRFRMDRSTDADLAAAEARGEDLRLFSDLHLYATFGSVP